MSAEEVSQITISGLRDRFTLLAKCFVNFLCRDVMRVVRLHNGRLLIEDFGHASLDIQIYNIIVRRNSFLNGFLTTCVTATTLAISQDCIFLVIKVCL